MSTLTQEQKDKLHQQVAEKARQGADTAAEAAKTATGWKKWAWCAAAALGYLLAGAALLAQQSCEQVLNLTPEQVHQAGEFAHNAYHAVTGKPCILVLPVEECDK